ncbi:MAG: hypothetical protein M1338_02105 [Patescibacteria group bacterium]|nr:hypothetical protein [Patescibacteria group bacterium]
MKNENLESEIPQKNSFDGVPLPIAIIIAGALLAGAWVYNTKIKIPDNQRKITVASQKIPKTILEEKVLPTEGITLPVTWGDLGKKLVSSGAIDEEKFRALYTGSRQFTDEYEQLLSGDNNSKIVINEDNAGYILNLLWALGLSNANPVLTDSKEMMNPSYGGAANFASTGGWTVAVGGAMDHYNRHIYFKLTSEQQALVDKVSQGIYRPCCGNSTHFPDCNHGMAMLGFLELMASQDVSEQDMWKAALAVNSYWFPDTYITIAAYMKEKKGVKWSDINPQKILGFDYSSGSGFRNISSQVTAPSSSRSAGGCGVDVRQQNGCGI